MLAHLFPRGGATEPPGRPRGGGGQTKLHPNTQVGPDQTITALSISFVEGSDLKRPRVMYLVNPPIWVGSVLAGGTIADTACGGHQLDVTTIGAGTSSLFWILEGQTSPRENWIMEGLVQIRVTVSMGQYADLAVAETAAMRRFTGLLQAELELARRKQEAMARLERLGGPDTSARVSVDHVDNFVNTQIKRLADFGEKKITETIIDKVQNELGLSLSEISDSLNTAKGHLDKMQSAADLIALLASADTDISDTDRIRAVKQAFDLARKLGPGGAFVTAIAPFLDFYSTALGAIADALDVIDELRKQQILSTGDCSIIEAIIADEGRRRAWQRACKVRQLLERIRDP